MQTILIVLHLLLALAIVGLVLMQHGKGADAGAAFGSGASATVFGSRGSANFLSRATGVLAAVFFLTSMGLAFFSMQQTDQPGLMEAAQPAAPASVPAEQALPEVPVAEVPAAPTESDLPSVPAPAE
jgi:preprotein translocase subunit SecG